MMSAADGGNGGVRLSEDAETLIENARHQSELGAVDVALAGFDQALRLEPRNAQALIGRAVVNRQRGELQAATDDLTRALELDAANLEARRLRGIVLEAHGLYDRALADYEIVARETPSADAFRNLGDVHLALGRPEEAERDYSEAVKLDSRFAEAYLGRGCAYGRRGQYRLAIDDFGRVIELTPAHQNAYFLRGYTYGLLAEHERALADLGVAVELAPNAEVHTRRAEVHAATGHGDLAEADYGAALEFAPDQSEIWIARGRLRLSLGRYLEAINDFTKALVLGEANLEAKRLRGFAYEALGQYEQAFDDYNAVVQAAPGPEAFSNRADVYSAMQDDAAAESDYIRALGLDESFGRARVGRARLRGGRGDYEAAIEDLSVAIERDPANPEAHYLRGAALRALRRYDDALADFRLVVDKAPSPSAYCDLGDVLMEVDDPAAASDAYGRAVELDERFERGWVGRGYAHGRTENLDRAHQDLSKALELVPDDLHARALLAMVLEGMDRLEDSLAEYDRVLESTLDADLLLRRGGVLASLARADDAETDYRTATEIEPDNVIAYVRLGHQAVQLQKFGLARDAFDAAISLDPANLSAYVGRGDAMVAIGECEQAISDYDRALEIDPQAVGALQGRSRAKQRLAGDFQERRLIRRMLESYLGALADLDRALELDSRDPAAYAEKAAVLRLLEGYDRAVDAATSGLRVVEDNDIAVWLLGEKGEALQLWGLQLQADDRLTEALEALEAAAQLVRGPVPAWLHELTGRTLDGLGRAQEARVELELAIGRDGGSASAQYALARLLLRMGEHASALDAFARLLELGGGFHFETVQAYVGQAIAFRAMGKVEEAERSLTAALADGTVHDYVWRALCLREMGEEGLGEAELRQAVELHPESGSALNALAWHYVDQNPSAATLDEALALAGRAVERLDEEDELYVALDTLGWVLFKLGRHDEAVDWLTRAAAVNPCDLSIRQHLEQARAAQQTS